jgi:heterodisulfide reductase subunit A-like polyferredoxin
VSACAQTPVVLLCECAGTMDNIDFDRLETSAREHAEVLRGRHWCSREGRARLLELMEAGDGRELVFAGCSADFAARRFQKLRARGLHLEIADIREGCSWVHDDDVDGRHRQGVALVEAAVATRRRGRRARPRPPPRARCS